MKGLIAAFAAFLVLAAPAQGALTVSTSPTTQAGAHADVTLRATFAQTPASIVLHLPPGLVGNPNAAARCPVATFEGGICPPDSRVGSATAHSGLLALGGSVYNLEPKPGEPARLGIAVELAGLVPLVRNEASVSLRPDGGLDSTIAALDTGGLSLDGLDLTLNRGFMTLPTSCAPATVTLNADRASFTPTGCENVPFAPSIDGRLESRARGVPSGATITLALPEGNAHVRRAEIALPPGMTLSPGVADGLAGCSAAQFAGARCPDAAQVGTVSFVTPLLGTLGGRVYFGDGFKLYVVVEGSGVLVKLAGDVRLDPQTGRITTVFDDLPQVPFTAFALTFKGGPHAVLANPPACGTHELAATLTPWSGTAPRTAAKGLVIDEACAFAEFTPRLGVTAGSTAAGRPAGAVTLAVDRPDGSENLARVTTNLPPGLAGSLKGVPVCPDAAADAGTCPPDTRVGSVSATAGSGDAPVALSGPVSLTGPTDGGLAGLALAIPGRVGPVDLGTVALRAAISLRPDGGLTVRTRPLPQLIGGVPVAIRHLALTLDRPGFVLNASSCAPQQVTAVLEGAGGAAATAAAPYQATDCASLPFTPRLSASIGRRGATRSGAHPPLSTVVTVPPGHSATAVAEVTLPGAVGIDLARLARACAPAAYGAGTCPQSSQIGTASAATPLLPAPLSGPVRLAVPQLGELPGLAVTLSGAVSLPLFATIDPTRSRLLTSFSGIPDVPLERFALSFTGRSPLRLARDVCRGARPRASAQFTAHSGRVTTVSAPMRVGGCPPVATLKRRDHRLTVRVRRGRDGAAIRRATLRPRRGRTLRFKRAKTFSSARRAFRVTVRDAAGETWRLAVRVRR